MCRAKLIGVEALWNVQEFHDNKLSFKMSKSSVHCNFSFLDLYLQKLYINLGNVEVKISQGCFSKSSCFPEACLA